MSSKSSSKQIQLIVVGLVAAVTISLVYYVSTSSSSSSASKGTAPSSTKKKLDDDADNSNNNKSTGRSVGGVSPSDSTPKKSNESMPEEKEMHTKIEELDKKGKALFKNKQVSPVYKYFCFDIVFF
jgi:FtsZ-interacting cell division protein ZipA